MRNQTNTPSIVPMIFNNPARFYVIQFTSFVYQPRTKLHFQFLFPDDHSQAGEQYHSYSNDNRDHDGNPVDTCIGQNNPDLHHCGCHRHDDKITHLRVFTMLIHVIPQLDISYLLYNCLRQFSGGGIREALTGGNRKADFPIGQLIFERLESLPMRTLQSPWQGR